MATTGDIATPSAIESKEQEEVSVARIVTNINPGHRRISLLREGQRILNLINRQFRPAIPVGYRRLEWTCVSFPFVWRNPQTDHITRDAAQPCTEILTIVILDKLVNLNASYKMIPIWHAKSSMDFMSITLVVL